MADAFEALFTAAAPGMLSALGGRTVSLDPDSAGTPKNIQAILRAETRAVVSTDGGDIDHEVMEASIAASFDDGSAYTPKELGQQNSKGDKITDPDNSEVWYLVEILDGRKGFGGMVDVRLKSKQVADASQG